MFPLSYAQRRIWFLDRLHGADATYHLPLAWRLHGPLDVGALRSALADVTIRHEVLRTVFPEVDGEPVQRVLSSGDVPSGLVVTDVAPADLPPATRAAVAAPFAIDREPPLRATLFRLADQEAVLLLVLHHIAADGWSLAPLTRDLSAAYRARVAGRPPGWDDLPIQYVDYTLWQRELLGDPGQADSLAAGQLAYWRDALRGLPDSVSLPVDRPRPPVAGRRAAAVRIEWDARRCASLARLAAAQGCTLFMVVQAGLAALLGRSGAGEDVAIGTVVAGRGEEGLTDLVGFFVNTLVLRTDLSGDPSFVELLRRVRQTDLDAYAHQDLPFDLLVQTLAPPRTLARHPLFQVMIAFDNTAAGDLELGALRAVAEDCEAPTAKVDLNLQVAPRHDAAGDLCGLVGSLEYATDLFDRPSVAALATRLGHLLDAACADPGTPVSRLPLLSAEERHRVLTGWNDTDHHVPVGTLHGDIRTQAARRPDAAALVRGDETVSYRELDRRADRLAAWLVARGVTPGDVVGVALPRSTELVVALVATLRCGAAYLPLDPEHPPERVALLVRDARPTCLVTDRPTRDTVPVDGLAVVLVEDALRRDPPGRGRAAGADPGPTGPAGPVAVDPRAPAYVIYTSGSTGRPKGVTVSHRAIDNRLRWMQSYCPLDAADRVLQKTSTGFDVSVWELFWPLRVGAVLVLAGPGEHRDPALLARGMRAHAVTVAHFVPAMFRLFLAEPAAAGCASLRRVFASGEVLPRDLVDEFHRLLPGAGLENLYGPTEAAVDVTAHPCRPGGTGPVPIGRPVWNTRARVLDEHLQPCPVNVPGELYLTGVQLAEGYLHRPALTAASFVADPFGRPGERMYRTGDLARWRRDGELDYLGRNDRQAKLRGQRLEPAEIEAVLRADPTVGGALATVRADGDGDGHLAVYVTPAPGVEVGQVDPVALRALLTRRLPGWMVPPVVTVLASFPLSPNGKHDLAAMPAPRATVAGERPARTREEAALAAIVGAVLGVADVRADSDFFALGGHSILAVRLVRRIREALGVDLPVQRVFQAPVVADLARYVSVGGDDDAYAPMLRLRAGTDGVPLFMIHPAAGLSWCYFRVLRWIDPARPVYGLQSDGLRPGSASTVGALPATMAELAEEYARLIRSVRPTGPYHLVGWSFGGHVAHAVATVLERAGDDVPLLVMCDSYPPLAGPEPAEEDLATQALTNLLGRPPAARPGPRPGQPLGEAVLDEVREAFPPLAGADAATVAAALRVGVNNLRLLHRFEPGLHRGDLTVVAAGRGEPGPAAPLRDWRHHVTGEVRITEVDCGHHEMFSTAAEQTGERLAEALAASSGVNGPGRRAAPVAGRTTPAAPAPTRDLVPSPGHASKQM